MSKFSFSSSHSFWGDINEQLFWFAVSRSGTHSVFIGTVPIMEFWEIKYIYNPVSFRSIFSCVIFSHVFVTLY